MRFRLLVNAVFRLGKQAAAVQPARALMVG